MLPKSAAGEGCTYTLGIWKRLIRFLDYPELELSNNLAENSMRPIAVGRGNCILGFWDVFDNLQQTTYVFSID